MENKKLDWRSREGFCFRHFLTRADEMNVEKPTVSHCHHQCEIYYYVSGKARFTVNEKVFIMEVGDVLVIQGGNHHTIEVDSNFDYERYCIEIEEELIPSLSGIKPLIKDFNSTIHAIHIKKEIVEGKQIFERFQEIEKICLDNNVPFKEHVVLAEIIKLATSISHLYESTQSFETIPTKKNKNEENINRAFEYINQNLDKSITVDELCKYAYLSRSYFQHVFKEYTGLSVTDYIMRQKMNTARYMLINGYSLTEASNALGYKYYSLFSVHYKKFFGVSPKKVY